MDDFLILLQAKLDEAKSKGNVNADIDKLQGQIDKLKIQAEIDPKSISNIVNQMSKLGIQIGQDFGKAFNNGLSNTINTNVLSQINKISDSSTSTIVQNEKKKQEAYKATSDAVVYHAGVISKLNKAETNGRFYGSNRGTGYFGTGHYFVDSKTKHELDNNSSYSKMPYTSVDISKYDNLFKATTDEVASKLHSFLENLTKFTQGSDRFNIDELFSQFKNVFTDTTMDIKDFGDKMEQLKSFMSNSNLSDRSDSVSTQFMKSLGYGGVDTRGTKYADTRYGTVIYDLKEESVLQANITDELQKQGQMLEKINYEKGQVFDSSADAKIQEQIDAQRRLIEVKEEFKNSFNTANLDSSQAEFDAAQKRLTEIDNIISDCKYQIDHADEAAKNFARDMEDLGLEISDEEMKNWKQDTATSYQKRIEELSLERAELEKRIPVLEENYNKESQLASEAYKQAEQIVEQRRLEAQQSSITANEVIQNEERKQQAIQNTNNSYKSFSELKIGTGNIDAVFDKDGVLDIEQSLKSIRDTYSEFGKVKITNKLFDPDGSLKQFRVEIQQTNGDLKESRNFMMALSEDGKSFCFPEDAIRGAESFVHHLNDGKKASNDVLTEEQKLANIMGDVREKTELARQAEEQRQQTAQNKLINKALEDEYKQRQKLADQVNEIQLSMDTGETESKVDALIAKTNQWTDVNGNARISTQSLTAALDALALASNEYIKTPTEENQRKLIEANEKLSVEYKKVASDVRSMNAELAKDSAVNSLRQQYQNFYSENGKAHRQFGNQLKSAIAELASGAEIPKQRLEKLKKELIDTKIQCKELGLTGQTWFQNLGDKIKSLTTYLSGAVIISKVTGFGKDGLSRIIELDTALVDLKKTTKMANNELEDFYYKSNDVAKQLGVTTKEIIEQASAWSRLGFNTAEAATKMAQYSSKFASISPGMSTNEAQEGLVSIIKAWGLNVEDVEREVMDNINSLGNSFAESNIDLVNGMKRSAAALAATGTTYQDAFALFTGAQEVVQNAEVTGRALRSISMRIHGYSEDSEDGLMELDEELQNVTGDLIDLTKTAEHSQGVSIFKDGSNTEFKSLVEYFGEINEIWDEMSQKQQNDFLDKAFGKNQAQAGAAIIQNYEAIAEAIEVMEGAAGSSEREMSIIMDSMDYKINKTKETATGIFQNLFKKEDMKSVVDGANSILGVLDKVTEKLGLFKTIGLGAGIFAGVKNLGQCA